MSRALLVVAACAALLAASTWWLVSGPGSVSRTRGTTAADEELAPGLAVQRAPTAEPEAVSATALPEPGTRRDDERWIVQNNEAVTRLDGGDVAGAVELLEACVAARPEDAQYQKNLGEALASLAMLEEAEGRAEEAVAHLERALELLGEREDLAALLARWRTSLAVEEGFVRLENEHFSLSFDGARSELLLSDWEVLKLLEDAYFELQLVYQRDPFREAAEGGTGSLAKIQVTLYREAEFAEVTGLGDWAGGVFDGRVRVPVENFGRERASLEKVLHHELSHWFVRHLGGGGVPGWFNEGLCQWIEPGRAAAVAAARARLRGTQPFPLAQLEGSLATWTDANAVRRAYAQSLVLVDRIATHYGASVLWEMLDAEREGGSAEQAFRDATGVDLGVAQDDLFEEL